MAPKLTSRKTDHKQGTEPIIIYCKIRSYFQKKLLNQSFIWEFHCRWVSTSNSHDVHDLLRKHGISVTPDKDWLEVNFTEHWFHWSGKITTTDIIEPDIIVYCWREITTLNKNDLRNIHILCSEVLAENRTYVDIEMESNQGIFWKILFNILSLNKYSTYLTLGKYDF